MSNVPWRSGPGLWLRFVFVSFVVLVAVHAPPARAKERPGPAAAPGKGPDDVLQDLDRPAQAAPEAPARPPASEEALMASWERWAPLFAPRLRGLRPTKGGKDMPTIQRARRQGQRLSAAQTALVEKLRSMLTPYKALVVSGGVSLGSYQAGFLYYTTLILRRFDDRLRALGWDGPDVGRFRVVTGASAGSINGFLSSIAGCRTLGDVPEQSPFYNAWIKVGLEQLRAQRSTFDALFDHEALDRPVMDTLKLLETPVGWSPTACDGIFGVTATRLDARTIDINDPDANHDGGTAADVTLARQTEKFLLSFDVGGGTATPRFAPYRLAWEDGNPLIASVYPTLGINPAAKPGKSPVVAADVATLLRASAAFPLAFGPVSVPLTLWEPVPDRPGEFVRHTQQPPFLDGGLLDNTPLRLAQKLLLSEGCDPSDGADVDPRGATILFSKSGTEGWRPVAQPLTLEQTKRRTIAIQNDQLPKEERTVLGELGGFVGQFINNATDLEALEALEVMAADEAFDRPGEDGAAAPPPSGPARDRACRARRRIVSPEVPARGMPVAGQFLAHFGAFLEEDFRIFDFYQGVVDAQEHAEKHLLLNPEVAPVKTPEFVCFRAYRTLTEASPPTADPPALPPACGDVKPNLRALLRASARVRQSVWKGSGEDEFVVFLSALHDEGFRYATLADHEVLDADQVQFVLREQLHDALHELGRAQGGLLSPDVLAVSVGAKAGADLYRHRSPAFVAVGFSNGLELSAGLLSDAMRSAGGRLAWKLLPSLRWDNPDRFAAVDDMGRLSSAASLRTINLDAAGEARLEIDLRPLGPFQLELGLGYEIRQRAEAAARFLPKVWQPVSRRHGPIASASLILLQRVYLTLTVARWWQRPCDVRDVNVGCPGVDRDYVSYEPIETTRWPLRLGAGWRALW